MDSLGLHGAIKTSGSTGIHIYMPLPPKTPNEAATLVAQIVATRVAEKHPKVATIERSVKSRGATKVTSISPEHHRKDGGRSVFSPGQSGRDRLDSTRMGRAYRTISIRMTSRSKLPLIDSLRSGDIWAAQFRKKNSLEALI